MYVYESVFSGQVAGYVYSRVMPVDHTVAPNGNHLGPQIRDLEAVVKEGDSDVGICPLTDSERKFMESKLTENPNLLLDLYNKYKDFGYPMTNILSVVASASQSLYEDLQTFHRATAEFFPHRAERSKKNTVFCSELVSIIYKEIGHPSFVNSAPDTFTPLAIQVVPEFGNLVFYAKENKTMLLKPGNRVSPSRVTKAERMIKSLAVYDRWVPMPPSGGIPPDSDPAGKDEHGINLYIARVKIGSGYYLGKIGETWDSPLITYFNREVKIKFGHEVLASLDGLHWEDAENGEVPLLAVKAGIEEDGKFLYISRGLVGASRGILGGVVGKQQGWLVDSWDSCRAFKRCSSYL
ncbi:hypothetical protein BDR26DRAFT_227292 [Obelidium mucronatum]|nr:hypothetical protein BDR26DRAFT_227292 [Obelidium mucronatum]